MFTAHTVIQQKGYFGTQGHPPFDVRRVTRDSDTHVRPDMQGAGEDVPREAGGGVLENPGHTDTHESPQREGPKALSRGQGQRQASPFLPATYKCHRHKTL